MPDQQQPKLKVLLVDDSAMQLESQALMLSDQDFDVVTAHDGAEAIQKAFACRPDVILMDIEMPGMNGLQTTRLLRHNPVTADIPVIMVSMMADEEFMEQAFIDGCIDFITKPVHKADLITKISNAVFLAETALPQVSRRD